MNFEPTTKNTKTMDNINRQTLNFVSQNLETLNFIGDIHGNFNDIVDKILIQYQLKNSLNICLGDCGIGFHDDNYYLQVFKRINKRLKDNNNFLLMGRGNHDNPNYFNGKANEIINKFSNIKIILDYTLIKFHSIYSQEKIVFWIGGALSIDRSYRIETELQGGKKTYWEDELPIYDPSMINAVLGEEEIFEEMIIASHAAPTWAYPEELTSRDVLFWLKNDPNLINDCHKERETIDKIFNHLRHRAHNITDWFYGHYHLSKNEVGMFDIHYHLLDCSEIQCAL